MKDSPEDLARRIATPALMGHAIGSRLFGRSYDLHPWLLWLEQKVLYEIVQPGRKIIVVSVPPQNGKTTYFGLLLPAWYLGMNPSHQILFISYSEPQAATWGENTRRFMKQFGPELFGETVSTSTDSKIDWKMSNGFGGMKSAGIEGGITGNPGHLIICDDLLKGAKAAGSQADKTSIMAEIQDSVFSRFQLNTKMFVIATRWAEDDPNGQLIALSKQPEYKGIPIESINIKAIAEPSFEEMEAFRNQAQVDLSERLVEVRAEMEDAGASAGEQLAAVQAIVDGRVAELLGDWKDFLGRPYGVALQGQFDQDFYEEKRHTVDEAGWFSLYQGEPTVREGGMFPLDRWRYYTAEQLPDITRKIRVWDLAASEGKGDYTVGTLMGRGSNGKFYILDRERGRWGTDEVERRVQQCAVADGHETPIYIEEERAGAGKTVIASYERKMVGFRVEPAKAEGSKQSRATPYSNEQRKGNIYLPADAPWLKEWREEHVQADGDKKWPIHDDQIDTGAYAFKYLTEQGDSVFWDPGMLPATVASIEDPELQMEVAAMARVFG